MKVGDPQIGDRSFTYRGAKLWNNLRDNVKSSYSVKVLLWIFLRGVRVDFHCHVTFT